MPLAALLRLDRTWARSSEALALTEAAGRGAHVFWGFEPGVRDAVAGAVRLAVMGSGGPLDRSLRGLQATQGAPPPAA